MDTIDYINTITNNNFLDWIRCHNDMLHNLPESYCKSNAEIDDQTIRIISHILKMLYDDKITSNSKCCLLISLEENIEYFIHSKTGATHFFQSLLTDFKCRLSARSDVKYLSQMINTLCVICVHFHLPLTDNDDNRCNNLIENFINILMDMLTNGEPIQSMNLLIKYTILSTFIHLESIYPTILINKHSALFDLIQAERSILFELEIRLYSLLYRNDILNKLRTQIDGGYLINSISTLSKSINVNMVSRLIQFKLWKDSNPQNQIFQGSHGQVFKTVKYLIDQASSGSLTTCSVRAVIINCATLVMHCFRMNCDSSMQLSTSANIGLTAPLVVVPPSSFCDSLLIKYSNCFDSNIIDAFIFIRKCQLAPSQVEGILYSILNNTRVSLNKRQLAAYWLHSSPIFMQGKPRITSVPISKDSSSVNDPGSVVKITSVIPSPGFIRGLFPRSFDSPDINYCKFMLLSQSIVTTDPDTSDDSSGLLMMSMKNLIKQVQFYTTHQLAQISFRVMFFMQSRHPTSIVLAEFEKILEYLSTSKSNMIAQIVVYLTAMSQHCYDDPNQLGSSTNSFSSRCIYQIVKMTMQQLVNTTDSLSDVNSSLPHGIYSSSASIAGETKTSEAKSAPLYDCFISLQQHLQVLNSAVRLGCADIDFSGSLVALRDFLVSSKLNINITWLDLAYDSVAEFCLNLMATRDLATFYKELLDLLNEIQLEHKAINGKFIYIALISLSTTKVSQLMKRIYFKHISTKSFELIGQALVHDSGEIALFHMTKRGQAVLNADKCFNIVDSNEDTCMDDYFEYLRGHKLKISIEFELNVVEREVLLKCLGDVGKSLYGVQITFITNDSQCAIFDWSQSIIDLTDELISTNDCTAIPIDNPTLGSFRTNQQRFLDFNIIYPSPFQFIGRLSATKSDGSFEFCRVSCDPIEFIDICCAAPIDFSTDHSQSTMKMIGQLVKLKLTNTSFVSLNFNNQGNYDRFRGIFDKFLINNYVDLDSPLLYLLYIAGGNYHILIEEIEIARYRRCLRYFTDLSMQSIWQLDLWLKSEFTTQ